MGTDGYHLYVDRIGGSSRGRRAQKGTGRGTMCWGSYIFEYTSRYVVESSLFEIYAAFHISNCCYDCIFAEHETKLVVSPSRRCLSAGATRETGGSSPI